MNKIIRLTEDELKGLVERSAKRIMREIRMTILPITLFIIIIPVSSNLFRILSMSHVSPNHHSNAPPIMLKYPMHISKGFSGTMNAICAKAAIKSRIISGFESVTKKAVMPL